MYPRNSSAGDVARDFLSRINDAIIFPLITLMMAVALLVFLYGAFEFVKGASNEADRSTGKQHMLWGVIGLLVMLSAYTILYIAGATFGVETELDRALDGSNAGSVF